MCSLKRLTTYPSFWSGCPDTISQSGLLLCQPEYAGQPASEAAQGPVGAGALVGGHFEQALAAFVLFALGLAAGAHAFVALVLLGQGMHEVAHAHLILG